MAGRLSEVRFPHHGMLQTDGRARHQVSTRRDKGVFITSDDQHVQGPSIARSATLAHDVGVAVMRAC